MRTISRRNDPGEAHQFLVARTCAKLKTWQFSEVRVKSAPETPQPLAISGLVPDLTGVLEDTLYIFGVETPETLGSTAAHARMAAFAQYALGNQAVFVLVVPREMEEATYQTVRALGLPNTTVYPIPQWPSRTDNRVDAASQFPLLGKRQPS